MTAYMSTFEQSVSLLRQNKRAMADALNTLGFAEVSANTRASLIPMYVKWASGLLDISIAAREKATGSHAYFSKEEYQAMNNAARSEYFVRGVRLRANTSCIVIALTQQSLKWGYPSPVLGATSQTSPAFLKFEDARHETELIQSHCEGLSNDDVVGSPAASFVLDYRAFVPSGGVEDTTEWALPTIAHLMLMNRYRNELNEVLNLIGADPLSSGSYWSCCQQAAANAFSLNMSCGSWSNSSKSTSTLSVRPIAVEL